MRQRISDTPKPQICVAVPDNRVPVLEARSEPRVVPERVENDKGEVENEKHEGDDQHGTRYVVEDRVVGVDAVQCQDCV
jgi:hypothetical protein